MATKPPGAGFGRPAKPGHGNTPLRCSSLAASCQGNAAGREELAASSSPARAAFARGATTHTSRGVHAGGSSPTPAPKGLWLQHSPTSVPPKNKTLIFHPHHFKEKLKTRHFPMCRRWP